MTSAVSTVTPILPVNARSLYQRKNEKRRERRGEEKRGEKGRGREGE